MRVGIVFISDNKREELLALSKELAKGLETLGHHVDIIDGTRDVNAKLTIYNYLIVGTASVSGFGGKIPEKVSKYLASSGHVGSKRSFGFVLKYGMRTEKTLLSLMKTMEHEGMFIVYSDILATPAQAFETGKRLDIH